MFDSAAFDRVARHALFYKLSCLGVASRMINVLTNLYTDTYASVWNHEGLSKRFGTKMGGKQGCLLSPLLFSLFLCEIVDCLEGGVQLGDTIIKLLAYADDLVLLATDKVSLQRMIESVAEYFARWNLQLNLSKSKIMVFRNGGRPARHEVWWYNKEKIEVVNSYKYLGITLSSNLSLDILKREIQKQNLLLIHLIVLF